MIRCKDNSIYTGMTNNLERRMKEHFFKDEKCAKYTKSHEANKIEAVWRSKNKSLACKLEFYIKTLKKEQKENIIEKNNLKQYLSGKIDCRKYYRINTKGIDIP